MERKEVQKIAGILLVVIGSVILLQGFNIIDIPGLSYSVVTPLGNRLGLSVNVNKQPTGLAFVSEGYTYKMKVTVKNTGTVGWNTGWVNVRLGTKDSSVVTTTCQQNPSSCPSETIGGSFLVEQCPYGTDISTCREDLNEWSFGWSADGTNWNSGCTGTYPGGGASAGYSNKVCSIDLGTVHPGNTKTIYFRVTVPSGKTGGTYPFIVQSMAWADATYAVSGDYEPLEVGQISGTIEIIIGLLSVIAGLAIALVAFK